MAYTSLELAKLHLQIETEYTFDDVYIINLIDVCELAVSEFCNGGLDIYDELTMPKTIRQATLLMIGHYYSTRQINAYTTINEVPYSFKFLCSFYRNNVVQ